MPWSGRPTRYPVGRETFSLLVKVGMDGTVETVADLGKFERENNPDQTVPDSNPFGITIGPDGNIYVADAGGNDVLKITPAGQITPFAIWRDNPVPTAVAFDRNGVAHVGFLTGAPFQAGASRIDRMVGTEIQRGAPGLSMVTDLKFGPDGALYVLEHAGEWGGGPPPTFKEKSGRVVRMTTGGGIEPVVTGLNYPTKMTFGPDGALYIANNSSDVPADQGQILRATFPAAGALRNQVARSRRQPRSRPTASSDARRQAVRPAGRSPVPRRPLPSRPGSHRQPRSRPAGRPRPGPLGAATDGSREQPIVAGAPAGRVGATLMLVGVGVLRRRR